MKKIQIEIEVEHEKDETVFFMSYKGLPRKSKVVGYFINTLENEIDYFVKNSKEIIVSYPFKSNELFKTYEDMMKKRKLIAPAEAKRLLAQSETRAISFLLDEDFEFLKQRAALSKSKK